MADNLPKIMVKPGDALAPGQVAIWEQHPEHPDGEVFVAAPNPGEDAQSVRVARTPEVSRRLEDGRLVQARRSSAPDEDAAPAETETDAAPARGRRAAGAPEG